MVMRYHWGLGIGHNYSHGQDIRSQQYSDSLSIHIPEDIAEDAQDLSEISPKALTSTGENVTEDEVGSDFEQDSEPEYQDSVDISDDTNSESSAPDLAAGNDYAGFNTDNHDEDLLDMYDTYGLD